MWALLAAPSVIHRSIRSVYPRLNGPQCIAGQLLNTVFKPLHVGKRSDVVPMVTVMWSNFQVVASGDTWLPSHFVPVIPVIAVTANNSNSSISSDVAPTIHVSDDVDTVITDSCTATDDASNSDDTNSIAFDATFIVERRPTIDTELTSSACLSPSDTNIENSAAVLSSLDVIDDQSATNATDDIFTTSENIQLIQGQRSGVVLVIGDYMYSKDKNYKGKRYALIFITAIIVNYSNIARIYFAA